MLTLKNVLPVTANKKMSHFSWDALATVKDSRSLPLLPLATFNLKGTTVGWVLRVLYRHRHILVGAFVKVLVERYFPPMVTLSLSPSSVQLYSEQGTAQCKPRFKCLASLW